MIFTARPGLPETWPAVSTKPSLLTTTPLPEEPLLHRDAEQVRRGAFQPARLLAQGDASVRGSDDAYRAMVGRLSADDISKMVKDAEAFREEDEANRAKVHHAYVEAVHAVRLKHAQASTTMDPKANEWPVVIQLKPAPVSTATSTLSEGRATVRSR